MSSLSLKKAAKTKPAPMRLKPKRKRGQTKPRAKTFLERLGDALVTNVRARGIPFCSVVVDLEDWSGVDKPVFRQLACPANPLGDRDPRGPLEEGKVIVQLRLMYVDVRGAEKLGFASYAEGDDYPDTSIYTNFVLHERLVVGRVRGKKKQQEQLEKVDREMAALLPRLRALPHCTLSAAYMLEIKSPESTRSLAVYVDLLSRFGPDAPPQKYTHNDHLLEAPFPTV